MLAVGMIMNAAGALLISTWMQFVLGGMLEMR
jgi:hypothetical protein